MPFLARLARGRRSYLYVFLLSLGLSAFVTSLTGVPAPETHDEFSYLLAADTFAHGRLTNPPHPLCQHFESFHILQRPTYQSKYQPGQGMILALGQVVTGLPIAGAWLSAAMAAAAMCWALRPMLSRRDAFLAGLLVVFHPLVMLWSQNYWGGSLPAIGGALVFGAAVRLSRRPTPLGAAVLVLGGTVLFNTRPYEGLVFTALVATPLLLRRAWVTGPIVATLVGLLAASACWTGYYDYRVTGHPFELPYLVHERQYALAPPFVWQGELGPKEYRHEAIRRYNEEVELPHYRGQRALGGFIAGVGGKLLILVKAYGGQPVLAVGLLGLPFAVRRRAYRLAGGALVMFVGGLMLSNWTFAHYAGPGLVLFVLLAAAGLREVGRWRRWVLPVVGVVYLGTAAYWVVERVRGYPASWGRVREALVAELVAEPGDDLVIVRNATGGNINAEWVYNGADIDGSPVVFARDMGEPGNAELIRYFGKRTVWLLDVGSGGIRRYGSPN